MKTLLLCLSMLALLAAATEQPKDMDPVSCEVYGIANEQYDKYHGDNVCDRSHYNAFKASLERGHAYNRMKPTNEMQFVPNQKTVVCPLEVEDLLQTNQPTTKGFDTMWIVENTSSEPVVLSYVKSDGIEYSAINPKITPPQNDPQAILNPRHWRAIYAFDGHVFHARSFDPKSGMIGPVVLQHRAGLIPIGAKFQELECPAEDPEPIVQVVNAEPVRDPKFQRTPPAVYRPCNTIDIGFRNMANCPLHGYFIASSRNTCQEKFKFHLGRNPQPLDFMWGWDSPTKFEGSFVGHSFAFRSAANPSILVDTVTIQPTRITDCPTLKEKAQVNRATTVGDMEQVFLPLSNTGEVSSKEEQVEDTLLRMDSDVMVRLFNETYGVMNATATTARRKRSAALAYSPLLGVNSY